MLATGLLTAGLISVFLTLAFARVLGRHDFRWSTVSLSLLFGFVGSWLAAAAVLALALVFRAPPLAAAVATAFLAVVAVLFARAETRRSLHAALTRAGAQPASPVVAYFVITLLLLTCTVFTAYTAIRLF